MSNQTTKVEKTVKKRTFTVWAEIEEYVEYTDGTEDFIDRTDEETRSCGRFSSIEEAVEQMNEIANNNEGDFTVETL